MVFKTTPLATPDLDVIIPPNKSWYDQAGRGTSGGNQVVTPAAGLPATTNDGREAIWVKASAEIASAASPGTQLALTRTTSPEGVTAAAGTGGFYPAVAGVAIAADSHFWAIKGTTTL